MFAKSKLKEPTVDLFEVIGDGASFSWNDNESRAAAFEMFVELARRLEGESVVRRLTLSGLIGAAIDDSDLSSFVERAPELLNGLYQAYEFDFRLNEGERTYRIRHLDQGIAGIAFQTPVGGDAFWFVLGAVLNDYAKNHSGVKISFGSWPSLNASSE